MNPSPDIYSWTLSVSFVTYGPLVKPISLSPILVPSSMSPRRPCPLSFLWRHWPPRNIPNLQRKSLYYPVTYRDGSFAVLEYWMDPKSGRGLRHDSLMCHHFPPSTSPGAWSRNRRSTLLYQTWTDTGLPSRPPWKRTYPIPVMLFFLLDPH